MIGDGAMSAGMAFEALNNAGIAGADLLVILNDNEMSISEPVGAFHQYLAKVLSSRFYNTVRRGGKEVLSKLPPVKELREALGRAHEGHGAARHAVRGIRVQLHRPDRRPRSRGAGHDALQRARAQGPAVPARDHAEGLRLRPRRGRSDPLSRRDEVRPGRRHRAEVLARQADLHAGVRRLAVRHGGGRSAPRGHHAGDARRLGPRALLAGVPEALFRRRHRRTARRHVRRRSGVRRHEAGGRDLFDVPAARATTS